MSKRSRRRARRQLLCKRAKRIGFRYSGTGRLNHPTDYPGLADLRRALRRAALR